MIPASTVLAVVGVVLLAAFIRSCLGFGDAIVAMPVLALFLSLKTAAPLVAFVGPTISIIILAGHRSKGEMKVVIRLVAASFVGIPIGVYGLARLPEDPLRMVLGFLLLSYGAFGLRKPAIRMKNDKTSVTYVVGLGAGILGGAYNTNGPPVVAYGLLQGWTPEKFRATLQGYFLPTGLFILVGHGVAGLWTGEVIKLYLCCLPGLLMGIVLGGMVNKRLGHVRFNRIVYITLLVMGLLLVIKSV